MADCVFCGGNAGWLQSQHDECLRRRDSAIAKLLHVATRIAAGVEPTFEAAVAAALAAARDEQGQQPVAYPDHLDLYVRELAFKRFLSDARITVNQEFVSDAEVLTTLARAATEATNLILDDHLMTEIEGDRIMSFFSSFGGLGIDNVSFEAEFFSRIAQAKLLRAINAGDIPDDHQLPYFFELDLQRSEKFIESFTCMGFYEETLNRKYESRVASPRTTPTQGGYVRRSVFQSEPLVTTELIYLDRGRLVLTTRHLYFEGTQKTHRIPYSSIVTFRPLHGRYWYPTGCL